VINQYLQFKIQNVVVQEIGSRVLMCFITRGIQCWCHCPGKPIYKTSRCIWRCPDGMNIIDLISKDRYVLIKPVTNTLAIERHEWRHGSVCRGSYLILLS